MSGLYAAAVTVCGAAIALALLSHFVTDGGTKRLLCLVMGAFMVCTVVLPLRGALTGLSAELSVYAEESESAATADEAYNREVLRQTKQNLEAALSDLLAQNGYPAEQTEVILALTDENRVIISQINITVSGEVYSERDAIARVTEENFAIAPSVLLGKRETDE